jgi:hypothetical protein
MRRFRATHQLTKAQRLKNNCRAYANSYERRGKIIRQPCQVCGDTNSEKHHPDYLKPLEIIWLCRAHHLALHRGPMPLGITNLTPRP